MSFKTRTNFALPLLLLALAACSEKIGVTLEVEGQTMGSTYSVKAVYPKAVAEPLRAEFPAAVQKILDGVDQTFSTYKDDSEVTKLNRQPKDKWLRVGWDMAYVIKLSADVWKRSLGAFDPTVAPLVDLWGFGPVQVTAPPTPEQVAAARALVGFDAVQIEKNHVKKRGRDLRFDFSGIAQGFAADQVAKYLDKTMASGYMIDISGEMRLKGTRDDGKLWRIAIEKPIEGKQEVLRVWELTDAAVATSGNYRNIRKFGDQKVSHTIDAGSGYPLDHHLRSATIVHNNAAAADAWATAMMAAGPETAMTMAERYDLPVLLIVQTGKKADDLEERASPALKQRLPSVYHD